MSQISIKKMQNSCDEVCLLLKALSHPQRLLVLGHLLRGSKTVGELVELCGVAQSQMSQFLIRMKYEGLVRSEKNGKFQVYSIADKKLIHVMKVIQKEYC